MQVLWMFPAASQHTCGMCHGGHPAHNQNLLHFDCEDGGPASLLYPPPSDSTYLPVTWELFRDKEMEKQQKNATATATVSKESSGGTNHDFY